MEGNEARAQRTEAIQFVKQNTIKKFLNRAIAAPLSTAYGDSSYLVGRDYEGLITFQCKLDDWKLHNLTCHRIFAFRGEQKQQEIEREGK